MSISVSRKLTTVLRKAIRLFLFKVLHPGVKVLRSSMLASAYSQKGQDVLISTLLSPLLQQRGKTWSVLDVGCNQPELYSNSFLLETEFGCQTIAVDPIADLEGEWTSRRPTAVFEPVALGSQNRTAELFIPKASKSKVTFGDMFSFLADDPPESFDSNYQRRTVQVTTLSAVLDKHRVREVLFCSIDVEGKEFDVLRGIDFSRHRILSFAIENTTNWYLGSEQVRTFMRAQGYHFCYRVGNSDDIYIHRSILSNIVWLPKQQRATH